MSFCSDKSNDRWKWSLAFLLHQISLVVSLYLTTQRVDIFDVESIKIISKRNSGAFTHHCPGLMLSLNKYLLNSVNNVISHKYTRRRREKAHKKKLKKMHKQEMILHIVVINTTIST